MTSSAQHFFQYSLTFFLALLQFSSGSTVHLKYSSPKFKGQSMPEELNVTLHGESGSPTFLHLRLAESVIPNVPLYILGVDERGTYFQHRENLADKKNIGYYQDVNSEAVIQATRVEGEGNQGAHIEFTGQVKIGGRQFSLTSEGRIKRDTSSLSNTSSTSDDTPYSLLPQNTAQVNMHDYLEAPPEVELKVVETVQPKLPVFVSAESLLNKESSSSRRRRQSQAIQKIIVDVTAVIDNAAYSRFHANSASRTDTLQSIREYYAFIFSGVDLRYQGIIHPTYAIRVRLIKIIIAENSTASTFTERYRRSSPPWDKVDALDALTAFSTFAAGVGRDILFPNDHAMLFTGFDIVSTQPNGDVSDSTTGLAYTSTLCRSDGKSVSIVEDLGGLQCVDTATHELGHSYSALHDGDGNNCKSSDRYIMSAGGYQATPSNKGNPWYFSQCSIDALITFTTNKVKSVSGKTCLIEELPVSGVPNVTNRLPGQEFSADDQCRMIYGNESRMCRGEEFGSPSEICTSMYCYDPTTSGTCYGQKATTGTTCGNGKLCLNGQCVLDSRAPAVEDDCVFGDQPGIAFQNQTCGEFVANFNFYCDQPVVRSRCCSSCRKVYRNVQGCEYGDKVRGCTASICRFSSSSTLRQCCRTCDSSAPPAPPEPRATDNSARSSEASVRISAQGRTTPNPVRVTTAYSTCQDNPYIQVNGQPCIIAVRLRPDVCNNSNVKDACCSSCKRYSSISG